MYRVIRDFSDLQDKEHIYRVGDTFPRTGLSVSEDRIKELSTGMNRRGVALITEVEDNSKPKKIEDEPKEIVDESKAEKQVLKRNTKRKTKDAE